MFNEDQQYNFIFVKLNDEDLPKSLESLKGICTTLIPHRPFEYDFVDQQFEALYHDEQRMGSIFSVFATLAIVIACLGLLGLVSFSAVTKDKRDRDTESTGCYSYQHRCVDYP
jgi:putative ABC transport system permease protein